MKIKRLFTQILAVALCLVLLCPLCAFADGEEGKAADSGSYVVIDPDEMQSLVEAYVTGHSLNKNKISVGYCYLDTGDTWYYNGDHWYFGAGVYYVPLMMIMAERESKGEITRDSQIADVTLGEAEENVLVYSNNYYAHQVIAAIGSEREVRGMYQAYSPLPEDYYDPDFLDYSYFSAHFLTDVMKTLYYDEERFPNIMDCMKRSDNGKYFEGAMDGVYGVAQRYGNFIDRRGVEYNNCTGIFDTPHPFVLTVMTENMGVNSEVMWDMAIIFKDYTLRVDEVYESRNAAPSAPTAPGINLPAGGGENENNGQPVVQIPGAGGSDQNPEGQNPDSQAPAVVVTEPEQTQQGAGENDPAAPRRMTVLLIAAAVLVILMLGAVLRPILRKKGKH